MKSTGSYEVAHHNGTYFLKLSGHLTYSQCGPLSSFLDKISDKDDYKGVLVDLREAQLIDSTNIGLLARLALHVKQKFSQPLTMLSTAPAVTHSLKTTGLHHLAILLDAPPGETPPQEQIQALPDAQQNIAQVMLDAHHTLMELNDENKSMYQEVVELLQDSLNEKQDR